ncbi:thioesterase II family protein [Nocardiopsis baichengensis]|uniref:thioesterase II family protein n=1 Tax=Nocardiopsis baichengensis TaxID=280240 RepID=UPI00034D08A2|nr:alpha/beta fold hydrolase [Nocardiopsis baichengensis]
MTGGGVRVGLRGTADGSGPLVACFPHAGGAASAYRNWPRLLAGADVLAVQYPGREDRLGDPFASTLEELADAAAGALAEAAGATGRRPVLFGHSMGASVAYETALRLRDRSCEPALLAVSGRPAPAHQAPPRLSHLDDRAFLERVAELGGLEDVLRHPELAELVLPQLRADYGLLEAYRPAPAAPLSCPAVAALGSEDPTLTESGVADWQTATSGAFRLLRFPGGHFYLRDAAASLTAELLPHLPPGMPVPAAPGRSRPGGTPRRS